MKKKKNTFTQKNSEKKNQIEIFNMLGLNDIHVNIFMYIYSTFFIYR